MTYREADQPTFDSEESAEAFDELENQLLRGAPVAQVQASSRNLPEDAKFDETIRRQIYFLVNDPTRIWPEDQPGRKFVDYQIVDSEGKRIDTVSLPVEEPEEALRCCGNLTIAEGWVGALGDAGWQPCSVEYLDAIADDKLSEYEYLAPQTWVVGEKIPVETVKTIPDSGWTTAIKAWLDATP